MTDAELAKACDSAKRMASQLHAISQIVGSPWKEALQLTIDSFQYVDTWLKGQGIDDALLACELTRIAIETGKPIQATTTQL